MGKTLLAMKKVRCCWSCCCVVAVVVVVVVVIFIEMLEQHADQTPQCKDWVTHHTHSIPYNSSTMEKTLLAMKNEVFPL